MKGYLSVLCAVIILLCPVMVGMTDDTQGTASDTQTSSGKLSSCKDDADCDELPDTTEDANGNGTVDKGETDPKDSDTDNDGLLDGEEGDRDGDGKLSTDESSAVDADTDSDGLNDKEEDRLRTKPNLCDTDGDKLSDGVEAGYIQPTDKNGCHGLQAAGTNYKRPSVMDPLNPDSDSDGLKDGEEDKNGNGWVDSTESDPSVADSDGDGLSDAVEMLGDFDGDGVADFDVQSIKAGSNCSPPTSIADLDCDGMPNVVDVDSDNDTCADNKEGGWVDINSNSIPDVYDNQTKSCPQETTTVGGSQPSTSSEEKKKTTSSAETAITGDGRDSAACALVRMDSMAPEGAEVVAAMIFGFVLCLLAIFYARHRGVTISY